MKLKPRPFAKTARRKRAIGGDAFALERFVPYRLSVLSNTVSRAIASVYAERFAITIAEWRCLAVLGRFQPMSANDLCRRTAMDKVRVSRALARLLATGLVERATDGLDRRRSVLRLSPTGRRLRDKIGPLARAAEARLLAGLSAAERASLDRLLGVLSARARARPAAPPGSLD